MSERNDELTRLSYTLGENMEDRFYVYMLQDDNGKPFYIGKGQGGRVFCHENDADKLLEVIRSENGDRNCLLYTSPSPRDPKTSRMPSSA